MRVSGGATKRVNSANPVRAGAQLAPVLGRATETYRAAGQPVRFRLTPLAEAGVDRALADAGYAAADPSWTMIAPLDAAESHPAVRVGAADAAWCSGHALASGWDEQQRVAHAALLERRAPPCTALTIAAGGPALGFAAASVAGGLVHLYDVVVLPDARGRGLARALCASALAWGAANGARTAMLQVLANNAAARRVYAALGFVDAYPYHYRVS